MRFFVSTLILVPPLSLAGFVPGDDGGITQVVCSKVSTRAFTYSMNLSFTRSYVFVSQAAGKDGMFGDSGGGLCNGALFAFCVGYADVRAYVRFVV